MRDFLRLTWKEARELLRPRYLLPILLVPVIFLALGQGFGGIEDNLSKKPKIGVIDKDSGEYSDIVMQTLKSNADIVHSAESGDTKKVLEKVKEEGGNTVLVIPEGFTNRLKSGGRAEIQVSTSIKGASITSFASSAQIESLIQVSGRKITLEITGATPKQLDPLTTSHTTYIKGKKLDRSPSSLSNSFMSQFLLVPVVMMMVILVSGQMVINSMGIEKENKTLETLLTMPVKRRTIVGAKLLGSASIGLVAAGIYTVAIYRYQSSFSSGSASSQLTLGGTDFVFVGISLFFALVGALALALCLGIFARDRQGAQILLFPLSILAIIPMFVTMFTDFDSLSLAFKAIIFIIPFSHPIIATKQLLFGGTTVVIAGIIYNAIFATAMIGLAVRLFSSDRLITGSAGRLEKLFSMLQR